MKRLKTSNKDRIFILLIFFIILLGIYLMWYTRTESFKCISNPVQYTIGGLQKQNDAIISCSCNYFRNTNGTQPMMDGSGRFIMNMSGIILVPKN